MCKYDILMMLCSLFFNRALSMVPKNGNPTLIFSPILFARRDNLPGSSERKGYGAFLTGSHLNFKAKTDLTNRNLGNPSLARNCRDECFFENKR